jgi:predicted homoserine dehydrogenase-like protein
MVIADTALRQREVEGRPVRVGIVGAGVTGRSIARQLLTPAPGLRLAAISSRSPGKALELVGSTGASAQMATTTGEVEEHVARGTPTVVTSAELLCAASNIDVIVEVTGTIDFGAEVVLDAVRHRKHVVLVNAELDSTLGPILKVHADRAGVVLTNTDGDEPGVALTLLRYLRSIGLRPVAAGNLKGMIDPYRTPDTQREFARKFNQDPAKVTSFADGTKLAMEATLVANATGFTVGRRGMYGPRCAHVKEIAERLPVEQMLSTGLVDYALGAEPHTGAFVVVHEPEPGKRAELSYYKMGEGPLFVFYTPYHLPHVQVLSTIGRAALFHDATVAPIGAPVCEVVACAKRDVRAGEILDGVGGFMTYGVIENADRAAAENLLPMGIAGGCRLKSDLDRDTPLTYDHVELPRGRLCDRLRAEQTARFGRQGKAVEALRS